MIIDLKINLKGKNFQDIIDYINLNTLGKKYNCGGFYVYQIEKKSNNKVKLIPLNPYEPNHEVSKKKYESYKDDLTILYYKILNDENIEFLLHPVCEYNQFFEFKPHKDRPDSACYHVFGLYGELIETHDTDLVIPYVDCFFYEEYERLKDNFIENSDIIFDIREDQFYIEENLKIFHTQVEIWNKETRNYIRSITLCGSDSKYIGNIDSQKDKVNCLKCIESLKTPLMELEIKIKKRFLI